MVKERTISVKAQKKPAARGSERASERAREAAERGPRFQVPFTRKNYIAFGVGLALVIIGYICMGQPPASGFMSLTLAPILLVLGYAVVFPYAIMAREHPKSPDAAPKGD